MYQKHYFSTYACPPRLRGAQELCPYTAAHFGPRSSSVARALGIQGRLPRPRGAQELCPYTAAHFGPRSSSLASAVCVQGQASSLFSRGGWRFATPSRAGPWNPPQIQLYALLLAAIITPPLKLSIPLLCGSHGTTAVAHQAPPVVTATDGALSVFVCHVSCPRTYQAHGI